MNLQKFTQKSIEAIQNSQSLMSEYGNQQMEEEHVLLSLLTQNSGIVPELIKNCGGNPKEIEKTLKNEIDSFPKVSGSVEADKIYLSRELDLALNDSENIAKSMKDEFVSVEHILLSFIKRPSKKLKSIFDNSGITYDKILTALKDMRGNQHVTNNSPEDTYDVLKKY